MKRLFPLLLIYTAILLSSCSGSRIEETDTAHTAELNRMIAAWNHFNAIGDQDSTIITTRPFLASAKKSKDSASVQYAYAVMAQAWLLTENLDSLDCCLDSARQWWSDNALPQARVILSNTLGHKALKFKLDYAEALAHYLDAYECSRELNDVNNEIAMLYNIVCIYNIKAANRNGLKYSRTALDLTRTEDTAPYYLVAANLAMSMSYTMPESIDSAQFYLVKASTIALNSRLHYWQPLLNLQQGDILALAGDHRKAAEYYESALAHSVDTEPSIAVQVYLNYGTSSEAAGENGKAADLYLKGIQLSESTDNMEFRLSLYKRLADLLYRMRSTELASQFLRKYTVLSDSLAVKHSENEFDHAISAYNELQADYQIALRDIRIEKERSRLILLAFILSATVIMCAVLLSVYRNREKRSREAVRIYEGYIQRLESNEKAHRANQENPQVQLYNSIEEKMREGLFRQKNLTLDKLAEAVGSNRTYVSNTINSIAGEQFNAYVDSYRIKEATRILSVSGTEADIPLKQLADDVGYSSLQTFFSAFKRETGTTPGRFRKEHSNSVNLPPANRVG